MRPKPMIYFSSDDQKTWPDVSFSPDIQVIELGINDFGAIDGPANPDDPWSVGWHIYWKHLQRRAFQVVLDSIKTKIRTALPHAKVSGGHFVEVLDQWPRASD